MPPDPLIAIVQHQAECPAASLADWLDEAGARLVTVRPDLGARLPDPAELDGLVVLGGVMGANDDAVAPWLPQVRRLIRRAASAQLPSIGVCLGHQLTAVALGGRVDRNPRGKLRGLMAVGYEPAAADDPIFGALTSDTRVIHSNNDVVLDAPVGTVVLATAPDGSLQAARFAPTVWGVQWPPEADADIFAGWCEVEPPATEDEARSLIAEVAGARDELDASGQRLAARFAELCRARAATR